MNTTRSFSDRGASPVNRKIAFVAVNGIILCLLLVSIIAFTASYLAVAMTNVVFWVTIVLGCLLDHEFYQWVKRSKRSGTMDLLFIAFMFFLVYLVTGVLFTGILGAFAVYMIVGALELKGHQVVNKVVLITAITYNVLFATSLVDFFVDRAGLPAIDLLDRTFALSLWLILGLGFAFFGRKYIVVWRFMSPQYITLALYFMAWLLVATAGAVTGIDIFAWIYPALIVANVIIYFLTGALIDKFLGVKPVSTLDEETALMIMDTVARVKDRIGLRGKVKVGFGKYPIINAMAYGPVTDKRICIIAPDSTAIPRDELEAIVAHELAHLKLHHPSKLLLVNIIDIAFRWLFSIPATYYDFMFGKKFILFGVDVGILGFMLLNIAIFAFLYVFVRVMEANADLVVKRAGLGESLAKALYNLESYYALGKQVGLNVVLLADEKLDENHQLLNYIGAARVLHAQLYRPPRSIVVTTLLNSHPPTFARVASMLLPPGTELGSWEQARLPVSLLRSKNARAFSNRVAGARAKLENITRAKFLELFGHRVLDGIDTFLEGLRLHGNKDLLLQHQALAIDRLDGKAVHVQVNSIDYRPSISEPYVLAATRVHDGAPIELVTSTTRFLRIHAGDTYVVKRGKGRLATVQDDQPLGKVRCTLDTGNGAVLDVAFNDIKNQVSINELHAMKGSHFIVEMNEALAVQECVDVQDGARIRDVQVIGAGPGTDTFPVRSTVVDRHVAFMAFHRDEAYKARYKVLLEWLVSRKAWVKIFLKKPVNNDHHCQVLRIDGDVDGITIVDVFGVEHDVPFTDLDYMVWESGMVLLKPASQMSVVQKAARALAVARKDVPWVPGW